jgi:hypothetical protein
MVRKGGFEPPRLAAPPPQDGVSANSTTSALDNHLDKHWRSSKSPPYRSSYQILSITGRLLYAFLYALHAFKRSARRLNRRIAPGGAGTEHSPGQLTTLCVGIERPEGRVHFAGEHISACPYWMQGALQSGLRQQRKCTKLISWADDGQTGSQRWQPQTRMQSANATCDVYL